MAYDANIIQRAAARLEEDRRRRADQLAQRRKAAYAREPRLAELDKQLMRTMPEVIRLALRRGVSPVEDMQRLRSDSLALQEEYGNLLEGIGMARDALENKPACALCGDSGWRGTEMCSCLKELCAQEQFQELSKLLLLGEQSFDSFQMDFYGQNIWPGQSTSS